MPQRLENFLYSRELPDWENIFMKICISAKGGKNGNLLRFPRILWLMFGTLGRSIADI